MGLGRVREQASRAWRTGTNRQVRSHSAQDLRRPDGRPYMQQQVQATGVQEDTRWPLSSCGEFSSYAVVHEKK